MFRRLILPALGFVLGVSISVVAHAQAALSPEDLAALANFPALFKSGGWIAVAGGAVHLVLKVWQSGAVDSWLSNVWPSFQWNARTRWVRFFIVLALAGVGGTLSGMAAGNVWWVSLLVGLPGAASVAMALHETTQTIQKASYEASNAISIRTKLEPPEPMQ